MQRAVGDHIQSLPGRQAESERRLWSFVSDFTENKMDGDKLQKLYVKLKANKAAPSGRCLCSSAYVHVCVCLSVVMCVCFSTSVWRRMYACTTFLCAAVLPPGPGGEPCANHGCSVLMPSQVLYQTGLSFMSTIHQLRIAPNLMSFHPCVSQLQPGSTIHPSICYIVSAR